MPLIEIPHRVRELCLKQLGRFSFTVRRDERLANSQATHVLPTLPLNGAGLKQQISDTDKRHLEEAVNFLCDGHLELLGQVWPENASCEWFLDPQSNETWSSRRYTFDIPRKSGQGPGDVKLVWELSRLQHLQVLALGASVLDHAEAKDLCLKHLENWLDENPPYKGLGYACGIELASRVVSIMVIVTLIGTDAINPPMRSKLWRALVVHGRWIARFPSLFSSANNHLVAESAALYILGTLCPGVPEAGEWRSTGWKRLVREAERQILPDGVGAEQSPTYLAYTIEWLLLARMVDLSVRNVSSTELDNPIIRGACFIARISDIEGNTPSIGDNDEGVVIRPELRETNYLASVVNAVSSCMQRGELKHPAFKSDLRAQLLTDNSQPISTFAARSIAFQEGGYSVMRSGGASNELFLMFDHGPLGFAETAAHGHADALSIWLHLNGEPILTDFGTYRYNADNGWRNWARSTAAHNTIEIDRRSQSDMTGPFNWGRRAQAKLQECDLNGLVQVCSASHDGYAETDKIIHTRRVEMDGTSVTVTDTLEGDGAHWVSLNFHFASQLIVNAQGSFDYQICSDDSAVMLASFECRGLETELVMQNSDMRPGPGATSAGYNQISPSPSLSISGMVTLPYTCKSVFKVVERELS
jgi:hypothetical protein